MRDINLTGNRLLILCIASLALGILDDCSGQEPPDLPKEIKLLRVLKPSQKTTVREILFTRSAEIWCITADGIVSWHAETGQMKRILAGRFFAMAISPDSVVAAINAEGSLSVIDGRTGNRLEELRVFGALKQGDHLSYSPAAVSFNSKNTVAVIQSNEVAIFNVNERKLSRFAYDDGGPRKLVALFSQGKQLLLAGFPSGGAYIWNTDEKKQGTSIIFPDGWTRCAALSKDEKSIVVSSSYGQSNAVLAFGELASGRFDRSMRIPSPAHALEFSRNGKVIVAVGSDKIMLIHEKSRQIVDVLIGKWTPATARFSPDGRLLAATGADGAIAVWDLGKWTDKLSYYEVLSTPRLEHLWTELGEGDDDVPAINQFLGVPDQTLAFIASKLSPAVEPNSERLTRLIKDLDSPLFLNRENAARELESIGWLAKCALKTAHDKTPSPETKIRIEELLKKLEPKSNPTYLRQRRGVKIAYDISSQDSEMLLRRLASGAAGAYLTQQAMFWVEQIEHNKRKK